jgi:hypothetical protein
MFEDYQIFPPSGDLVFPFINDFNSFVNDLSDNVSGENYNSFLEIDGGGLTTTMNNVDAFLPFNYVIIS